MTIGRRDFLSGAATGAAAGAALPALLGPMMAFAQQQQNPNAAPVVLDEDVIKFWSQEVRRDPLERGGPEQPENENLLPEFLIFDEQHGFRSISEVPDTELAPEGDVAINMWVNGFRPAGKELEKFEDKNTASLRIDIQQRKPIIPILEPMAWVAAAAMNPTKGKSSVQMTDLNYTANGRMQNVPLPAGFGRWTWNLFLQRPESFLSKFIGFTLQEAVKFSPLFTLPAVAVPALHAVDSVYAYWMAVSHTDWIFKAPNVDVYATQDTKDFVNTATAVPLVPATYVLIPRTSLQQFDKSKVKDLEVQRGVIVPKGTAATDVFEACKTCMPEFTYLTVKMTVQKLHIGGASA
jgi:hypothetical protein